MKKSIRYIVFAILTAFSAAGLAETRTVTLSVQGMT